MAAVNSQNYVERKSRAGKPSGQKGEFYVGKEKILVPSELIGKESKIKTC